MEKTYLNISKASDIAVFKERITYRFLEMIPGLISLGTLFWVLVLSWWRPAWVAVFIILFCFYYLLKIIFLAFHQVVSYFKMKRHLKIDWATRVKKINRWKDIYHLIILPTYKEGIEVIEESVGALLNSRYPKNKMIVILAIEERAGKRGLKIARDIRNKYKDKFLRFEVSLHPKNIPGEIAGKGSNSAWAAKIAKKEIIDILKIPYKNVLVSNFDIDSKVYPDYFSCLTWYYLKVKNPLKTSYQPIPVYNNNVWNAHAFSRVVATSNTFWQMVQQERAEKLTTYSTHAMPFQAWVDVGYPANIVSDDSRIFWRAYLYYNGNYRVVPIYYPVSMDAVVASNLLQTAINQYRQQKRWAWGCNEIPYLIYGFWKNKKIPKWNKFIHLYTVIDGFWSWATAALLIFCLGWLPVVLGGEKFSTTILSYNLPFLTGRIMTFSLIGLIISAILSTLMLPRRPKNISRLKGLTVFLQWILLPFTLIIFGTFPALDAQIRLMLGRYMGFLVTEKVRK
ncbi:glycosyltransferase family 2 protein [Patescibacteria group bacterium]|nr:glycosyltransferase family 2 protein [Patescibacteria group bacterium]MBU4367314.1 glycosyltransferase family 2 protein [Patescibacteria group bacterium]MBU4461651.1 glycosyltransferase family 2 protein [Patescibacteria group bacterium]MCG2699701.1 glycosyltransferase family 2 protein [Candidatus Parcubacteria bacterium]